MDQVKNNALQLKLYQENTMQLNTCHSKFHTSIIDVHTIDEYIYPTSQIENNDRELYLKIVNLIIKTKHLLIKQ